MEINNSDNRLSEQELEDEISRLNQDLCDAIVDIAAVRLFVSIASDMLITLSSDMVKHDGLHLEIELLAFSLYPYFKESPGTSYLPVEVSQRCGHILDDISKHQKLLRKHKEFDPDRDEAGYLGLEVNHHTKVWRGVVYPEHTTKWITEVLGKYETYFASRLGIGPVRAQQILWGINKAQEVQYSTILGLAGKARIRRVEAWQEANELAPHVRTVEQTDMLSDCPDRNYASWVGGLEALNSNAPDLAPVRRT